MLDKINTLEKKANKGNAFVTTFIKQLDDAKEKAENAECEVNEAKAKLNSISKTNQKTINFVDKFLKII